jgi:carbonic anhydrase
MNNLRKLAHPLLLLVLLAALATPSLASGSGAAAIATDDAVKLLKDGNLRFQESKMQHPHEGKERLALTAGQGQHPLATILTCSDSRVPPELIFDQGIGDIFVVRVAGNVAAGDEIGSMEYAVDHLNTPVVVVLGHSQCGAVTAVVNNEKVPPNIAALVAPIKPAVEKAREENPGAVKEVILNAAIKDNVWQAVTDIFQKSPIIRGKVKDGKTQVLGAVYEIDTGRVQWLGPIPGQDQLVGAKGKAAPAKGGKKAKSSKKSAE